MEISIREDGRVRIVSVTGDLVIGESEASFKRAVTRLIDEGHVDLLLDLGKVGMVDSTGLGALVRTLTTAQKEGGQAKLLAPPPNLKKLLEMTQLDSVFDIHHDLEEAVASF
ncbi:MAG TPA: STAS domain-containing protein [Thermoanaerobaculia bacterium]|jgi:anti-sigma B factor antagonist|nr:STAS domain-containing protein [Thermoanaerobaculia bacterium]